MNRYDTISTSVQSLVLVRNIIGSNYEGVHSSDAIDKKSQTPLSELDKVNPIR
jgi:hypothetical protein